MAVDGDEVDQLRRGQRGGIVNKICPRHRRLNRQGDPQGKPQIRRVGDRQQVRQGVAGRQLTAVAVDGAAAYLGRGSGRRGWRVVQAARDFEVSWPVANAAFTAAGALPKDTPAVAEPSWQDT